jgi:hypothetical protein
MRSSSPGRQAAPCRWPPCGRPTTRPVPHQLAEQEWAAGRARVRRRPLRQAAAHGDRPCRTTVGVESCRHESGWVRHSPVSCWTARVRSVLCWTGVRRPSSCSTQVAVGCRCLSVRAWPRDGFRAAPIRCWLRGHLRCMCLSGLCARSGCTREPERAQRPPPVARQFCLRSYVTVLAIEDQGERHCRRSGRLQCPLMRRLDAPPVGGIADQVHPVACATGRLKSRTPCKTAPLRWSRRRVGDFPALRG